MAGPLTAQRADEAPGCWVRGARADLELRASPFDSTSVSVDRARIKVCYSRPRKLDRPIMGRLVPYGEPWRLGANEATAIHMPEAGTVAGVSVEPGWYSLYVEPEPTEWRVFVNESVRRWGIPINDEVRAQNVGSGTVPVTEADREVELMTMTLERSGASAADLTVAWDRTSVRIPVVLGADRAARVDP